MNLNRETIVAVRPDVTSTPGGYLAVSEADSPLRIGVVGATEQEARERFSAELEAWARLSEQPARPK